MAVYVDAVRFRYQRMIMCHMWADSLPELHNIAARLGLKRAWFQCPPKASWAHYDVSLTLRRRAVELGAIETDRYGALEFCARQNGDMALLARIAARRDKAANPS